MDSQVKQKATHDVHAKFREFYPGDRILIRDLRKENTWWPSSVAERSGPKSYIVVLNDGRVWKRHLDHLRRDSMDSAVSQPEDEREFKSDAADPAPFTSGTKDVPIPCQLPADLPVGRPANSGDQVTLETLGSPPVAEKSTPVQSHSAETGQTPLRRSGRVRNPPERLFEKI